VIDSDRKSKQVPPDPRSMFTNFVSIFDLQKRHLMQFLVVQARIEELHSANARKGGRILPLRRSCVLLCRVARNNYAMAMT